MRSLKCGSCCFIVAVIFQMSVSHAVVTLETRALTGEQAPGTDPGVTFSGFFPELPIINSAGKIAFSGRLLGPGVNGSNIQGVWSGGTGSLSLIARSDDAAPGTDAGVVFSFFDGNALLNGAGQIAFSGGLTGPGVDSSNDHGIWSEGSGSLDLVAREGDQAPGTDPGVVFENFGALPNSCSTMRARSRSLATSPAQVRTAPIAPASGRLTPLACSH